MGAFLGVVGALITCLYKGKGFHIGHHVVVQQQHVAVHKAHWGRGTLLLLGSCFSYATWFVVQVCVRVRVLITHILSSHSIPIQLTFLVN